MRRPELGGKRDGENAIEREWEEEGGVRTSQIKRGGLECGVCGRTRGRGELGWENEGDGSVHSLALSRRETKDAERPVV